MRSCRVRIKRGGRSWQLRHCDGYRHYWNGFIFGNYRYRIFLFYGRSSSDTSRSSGLPDNAPEAAIQMFPGNYREAMENGLDLVDLGLGLRDSFKDEHDISRFIEIFQSLYSLAKRALTSGSNTNSENPFDNIHVSLGGSGVFGGAFHGSSPDGWGMTNMWGIEPWGVSHGRVLVGPESDDFEKKYGKHHG